MYGMVNKSIEQMVRSGHGDNAWLEIKRRAGVTEDLFLSNEGYPDDITYRLVEAASGYLQLPAEKILFVFGEHWILHTARQGYGPMLAAAGRTLPDFLLNLPHFHDHVALIYPKLTPPEFEVTRQAERALLVHYRSHRTGLAAFMEGLLSGIGKMFETPVRISLQASKTAGADHDIFLVEW